MKYYTLPHTSLEISQLGLGTMTFGVQNSEQDAHQQLDFALEAGINFIDTAEMYPVPPTKEKHGVTESYIGSWLEKRKNREKIVLATKVLGPTRAVDQSIRPDQALDRKNIRVALDESLQRLKTDYIDLYQLHWPQREANFFGKLNYQYTTDIPTVSLLETLEALAEQVQAGKIRYIGVSNETAWGVMKYLELANKHNLPKIVSIQNPYSLLNRTFEQALAEISQHEGVNLLAYSCLGFGVLTGKYLNNAKPKDARNTLFTRFVRYSNEQSQKATEAYVNLAIKHGLDPAQMALAFVNQQPFVSNTILGATTLTQLKSNIESIQVTLSPEILAEIEAIHTLYPYPAP